MSGLLGPTGAPISTQVANKKSTPPAFGPAFGNWAGREVFFAQMPGTGAIQFDLSKLTLADYRTMREHYQVNASLSVLSFMQHQADWHLVGGEAKVRSLVDDQLRAVWTQLNRAMSVANWAGYSPCALEWENDANSRSVRLNKIKDLLPEECRVNWKEVEGWAPPGRVRPKFKEFDGIRQFGTPWPVPVGNSLWYALLQEHGDFYGRKPLKPAFTSWFFSILLHLYANRYYERFGEPTPIGRAPFDDEIEVGGTQIPGNQYLLQVLQNLRNRSVVVLPNDKTYDKDGKSTFDYEISFLESTMRGADFERYMTRLDEEISIGLFTPVLMMRTADVGSYNLGVQHASIYNVMLDAMNDDRAMYIDRYLIRKIVDFNFSERTEAPRIIFRRKGNTNGEMLKELLKVLTTQSKLKFDLDELGQMAGLTLKEVRETTKPDNSDLPNEGGDDGSGSRQDPDKVTTSLVSMIWGRVEPQVNKGNRILSWGYKRKFEEGLISCGLEPERAIETYNKMDAFIADLADVELTTAQLAVYVSNLINESVSDAFSS